jgi:hypothetical protein
VKLKAILIIAAMILAPIAGILSTSTVTASHTPTISADVSTTKANTTTIITVNVTTASGDAIRTVAVKAPSGFTGQKALVNIFVDNVAALGSNGSEECHDNIVWLPAGTEIVLLENENFVIPENTDLILSAGDNFVFDGTAYRLYENLSVEVTSDVAVRENDLPIFDNSGATGIDNDNIKNVNPLRVQLGTGETGDNRVRLVATTRVINLGNGLVQLPENLQVYVVGENCDNRLDKLADNKVQFSRDIQVNLTTNNGEFDNGAATFRTLATAVVYTGTAPPSGSTLTGVENTVFIPAGTTLQIDGAPLVRIRENTLVIVENNENLVTSNDYCTTGGLLEVVSENDPNNWMQDTASADNVQWENQEDEIASGENVAFPFVVTSAVSSGAYTFYVTTTDVNGISSVSSFIVNVDSEIAVPEIHVDPVWVGENQTVTITIKDNEAFTFDNIVLTENVDDQIATPDNREFNLKDNATSTDNMTWTVTYTTEDLLDNEGGYVQIQVLGVRDAVGNETSASTTTAFYVDRAAPGPINMIAFGFPDNINTLSVDSYNGSEVEDLVVENTGGQTISGTLMITDDNFKLQDTDDDGAELGSMDNTPENMMLRIIVDNVVVQEVSAGVTGLVSYSLTLTEGLHQVAALLVDRAGNVGADNVENVLVDSVAPTISFVSPTSGAVLKDNKVTLKVTIGDATLGIENENGLQVEDDSDNSGFRIDLLNSDGTAILFTSENELNPTAYVENSPFTTYTWENVFDNSTGIADGTYILRVVVGDNLRIVQENISFSVDIAAPSAPPSADLAGSVTVGTTAASKVATKLSTLTLTGTAETGATITLYVTTDGGATWTVTSTTATATAGVWSIANFSLSDYAGQTLGLAITATDSAGNESTRTLYGYMLYDSTAPSVTISSPTTASTTDQPTVTVTGTVTFDSWETASGITLTLQTGMGSVSVPITSSATGGTFSYSVALNEGANTIIARATDSLANIGNPSTIIVTRTVTSWATYAIVVVIIALILAAIAIFRKK